MIENSDMSLIPIYLKDLFSLSVNLSSSGDVDGSVEAILDVLSTYGAHHQCKLEILRFGVGVISDKDVELAHGFQGLY